MQKIIHIIVRSAKASFEKLYKAIRLFEWILQHFLGPKTSKTRYKDLTDKIHIEYTTTNHNCDYNKIKYSEKSKHIQTTNVTFDNKKSL